MIKRTKLFVLVIAATTLLLVVLARLYVTAPRYKTVDLPLSFHGGLVIIVDGKRENLKPILYNGMAFITIPNEWFAEWGANTRLIFLCNIGNGNKIRVDDGQVGGGSTLWLPKQVQYIVFRVASISTSRKNNAPFAAPMDINKQHEILNDLAESSTFKKALVAYLKNR